MLLHAPWPLASLDPHRIDDAAAAFFGEAIFDTLYARDARRRASPRRWPRGIPSPTGPRCG